MKKKNNPNNPIRPTHYGGEENPFEPIKVIEAWGLNFHLGNVVKYIPRAGKKDPNKEIEDLKKARWYLNRHIENLEKECNNRSKPKKKTASKQRTRARVGAG